jgi:hypothetical protein
MRRSSLQIRTRTTMLLVAVAAFGLAAFDGWSRSSTYRREANQHEIKLRFLESQRPKIVELLEQGKADSLRFAYANADVFWLVDSPTNSVTIDLTALEFDQHLLRSIAYHQTMAKRYRRASYFPWVSIAQEPPPPLASAGWITTTKK